MPPPAAAAAAAANGVPLRSRLTALAGAIVLCPDTALMRLTRLETSDSLSLSMGITFYRGVGRVLLIPPLWLLLSGKRPSAFVEATKSLGCKRLAVGMFLYMLQNMAFIVSAELTYIASVLAIVATGPLFSAAFSWMLLGEKVPRHTWIASLICAGFVVVIYVDSFFTEHSSARHLHGNLVALLVPVTLGLFWVLCKATPGQDMVPALSFSGLGGAIVSFVVIVFTADDRRPPDEDGDYENLLVLLGPLTPRSSGGGGVAVSIIILVAQAFVVALAFMLLTIGAKDVPSAEVSLVMLLELVIGPLMVWAVMGEVPTVRVFVGAAGIATTMFVESWRGLRESWEAAAEEKEEEEEERGGGSGENHPEGEKEEDVATENCV